MALTNVFQEEINMNTKLLLVGQFVVQFSLKKASVHPFLCPGRITCFPNLIFPKTTGILTAIKLHSNSTLPYFTAWKIDITWWDIA